MLRKEVKVGLVVGGIMLAVLVVYLLLIPGRNSFDQDAVSLDTGDQTSQVVPDAKTILARSTAEIPTPITPPTIASAPTSKPSGLISDPIASIPGDKSKSGDKSSAQDPWVAALDKGTIPMIASGDSLIPNRDTTGPSGLTAKPSIESAPVPGARNTPIALDPPAAPATQPSSADLTRSASTARMNTHVIRPGESLAKIAEVAYGSQQYFPHIIRANPGIDEKHLKPGTTINLPALADVKGKGVSVTDSAASATRIDLKSQYEVQPGDSLHKIALKLYGTEKKWETIYDLNKEMIGADPAKLKVKSVLKLPEAPTAKQ